MNYFGFKAIALVFFSVLFTSFGFCGVDLSIISTTVDGNLYNQNITFTIDYNNIGDTNATSDFNIMYDINDIVYTYTISSDLNAGINDTNSLVWDANLYGALDINICVLYSGDENTTNDCNSFTLQVYYIDLNAISLTSSDIPIYGENYDLNFAYNNIGDYNDYDYDIKFYFDTNLATTISLSDMNSDGNTYAYTFSSWSLINDLNDINAYACLVYSDDYNSLNNCSELDFNAYNYNLNALDVNFSDADVNISYGDDVNIYFYYSNIGDYNITSDFNILYYIENVLYSTQTISSDLNASSQDYNYYTWDSNISGSVDVNVCLSFSYDYNSLNNCDTNTIYVKAVDMNATNLNLNDSSVNEGDPVLATLTYKNSGDLDANDSFTVSFYYNTTALTCSSYTSTVTTDLLVGSSTVTKCTFTAPTVTSNTTYTIKGIVNYTGDKNTDNNYATASLTVANVSSSSGSSSSSSSSSSDDDDSGIDLDVLTLTYPSESVLGKDVTFTMKYKNIGDDDLTSSYSVQILITQKGTTIKNCEKTVTDDLDSEQSATYTCIWTPKKSGYYSVDAYVDYSDDDDTSNDLIEDKLIHIVDSNIVAKTLTTASIDGIKVLAENKTLETHSDLNKFIIDLNKAFVSNSETLPLNIKDNLYLKLEITRDFNCGKTKDTNLAYCDVKVNLRNIGDRNLIGYTYYEILPDLNLSENKLKFDVNNLDVNKDYAFTYTLASNITKDQQAKFLGLMLTTDVLMPVLNETKSSWNFNMPWKTILFVVIIVLGAALLSLIIYVILKYFKERSGYRNHRSSSYTEEAPKKWSGYGTSDGQKVKYKSGNYKVSAPKGGPKYKGWK